MCGTEPFPKDYRARKYRVERHFLAKVEMSLFIHPGKSICQVICQVLRYLERPRHCCCLNTALLTALTGLCWHHEAVRQEDFRHIMRNLPVHVSDEEIEEMFTFADTDGDGRLSYEEFEVDTVQFYTVQDCSLQYIV